VHLLLGEHPPALLLLHPAHHLCWYLHHCQALPLLRLAGTAAPAALRAFATDCHATCCLLQAFSKCCLYCLYNCICSLFVLLVRPPPHPPAQHHSKLALSNSPTMAQTASADDLLYVQGCRTCCDGPGKVVVSSCRLRKALRNDMITTLAVDVETCAEAAPDDTQQAPCINCWSRTS